MYQLVYVSSAVSVLSKQQVLDLLVHCRDANARDGITGILLCKAGNFMQSLEGEREAVLALYSRIAADKRHRSVTIVLEGSLEARQFEGCPMGSQDLDSAVALAVPGYGEFLNASLTWDEFRDPSRVQKLLAIFRRRRP